MYLVMRCPRCGKHFVSQIAKRKKCPFCNSTFAFEGKYVVRRCKTAEEARIIVSNLNLPPNLRGEIPLFEDKKIAAKGKMHRFFQILRKYKGKEVREKNILKELVAEGLDELDCKDMISKLCSQGLILKLPNGKIKVIETP